MIHRYEGTPPRVKDLADDFRFPPIGEADIVRTEITRLLPNVDWSDPAWGILDGDGYSIEFNLQRDGVVDGFMLHVRGGGDPVSAIARLCSASGWVALDTSTGEFMDLDHPSHEGWASFQSFRDQVIETVSHRVPWYRRLFQALRGRA